MERSHPEAAGTLIAHLPCNARFHLVSGLVGEGQCQDVPRLHALPQEMSDFVGEHTCLARTGTGNHKRGAVAVEHGFTLCRVEFIKVIVIHHSLFVISYLSSLIPHSSFAIRNEAVEIYDMKLQGAHHETGGIDTCTFPFGKETVDEIYLAFLQTLDSEGHTSERGNHVLRIAECQMAEESLVILINIVVNDGTGAAVLTDHALLEACHNLLQNGLVEDQTAAVHHQTHIVAGEQFARLEDGFLHLSLLQHMRHQPRDAH